MFRALAEKGINIQVISTSEIKVSVLVAEEYTELALRSLHTVYGLDSAWPERGLKRGRRHSPPVVTAAPVGDDVWAGSRRLLRRLRDLMKGGGSGQERLDKVVEIIAADIGADVCSLYVLGEKKILELFATRGLKPEAVHQTRLRVGEGLVGLIAKEARALALPDAQKHPNFAYRPETGEEIYRSFLGVPIQRNGETCGVLTVQHIREREYPDEALEALETVAMKKRMRRADRINAVAAVLLGEDELAQESATLRDLGSGEQKLVPLASLKDQLGSFRWVLKRGKEDMLKPALARGELHCVGATTLDEYRKHIEKDAALARRFQPVFVPEPSVEETISILRGLKEKYELHHGVRITDSAIVGAATLSNRYISDRFLPDKAIDLVDEAASRMGAKVRGREGNSPDRQLRPLSCG